MESLSNLQRASSLPHPRPHTHPYLILVSFYLLSTLCPYCLISFIQCTYPLSWKSPPLFPKCSSPGISTWLPPLYTSCRFLCVLIEPFIDQLTKNSVLPFKLTVHCPPCFISPWSLVSIIYSPPLDGDANCMGINNWHLYLMLTIIVFKLLLLHCDKNTWQKAINGRGLTLVHVFMMVQPIMVEKV